MTQDEIKERLQYQRAIYKVHECDDPAMREHFEGIIKEYEAKHPKQPQENNTVVACRRGREMD